MANLGGKRDFFYAQACLEFQQVGVCLRIYDVLASVFPHSDFLLAQRAIANYHLRGPFFPPHKHARTDSSLISTLLAMIRI